MLTRSLGAAVAAATLVGLLVGLQAQPAGATAPTYLTLYPGGEALPTASNQNIWPGQHVPNLAVARLSAADSLNLFSLTGTVHYLFDLTALVLG